MADSSQSDRALLIVDMTQEQMQRVPGARDLIRYIRGELRYFRERGRPVIFVRTREPGAMAPVVVKELTPRAGEIVLDKAAPSAFFGTGLEKHLPETVRRLTLVGLETPTSILLTAADALARGFQVVVPEPCAAAQNPGDHEYAMHLIRDVWSRTGGEERGPEIPLSQEGRAVSDEGEPA